jgi:hypothetical protein
MTSVSLHTPEEQDASFAVLTRAHLLRRAGQHGEAITRLDEAMRSALQHDEVFAGMALALKARSQLQLMDDAGAALTVRLVPALVRRFNPKVDAHCRIVSGLVHRRRAYRAWKAGAPDLQLLYAAIDCFAQARHAAEKGIEHRLAFVAELNRLYAEGLEAAIAGRSRHENPRLVVAAVQAEADARAKTPLEDAANVAGLTIIADLAIGAGLQPADLFALSGAPAYRQACRSLLRAGAPSWPHELLRAAAAADVPVEQKARALVLGGRCLTRAGGDAADRDLVQAYLVHLADCAMAAAPAQAPLPGLAEQLAALRGLAGQAFPGRRAFR